MRISFLPYRVLPSLPAFNRSAARRAILVDVGANGFYASPKHLIDLYAPPPPRRVLGHSHFVRSI